MTSSDNGAGPLALALLTVACAVGGALLTRQLSEGSTFAALVFTVLVVWVVAKFTGSDSPGALAIAAGVSFVGGYLLAAVFSWVFL